LPIPGVAFSRNKQLNALIKPISVCLTGPHNSVSTFTLVCRCELLANRCVCLTTICCHNFHHSPFSSRWWE